MLARVLILGLGLALAMGVVRPGDCLADEVLEAAKQRFEQGEKNFEAGKFLEAAADFEAAYKLSPRNDLLYDAARAYDRGGQAPRAVELYEAYLRTGDNPPEEEQVQKRLTELRPQVAYLLVRANKDGAHVMIDGMERASTPMLTPVPVGAGTHKIDVVLGDLSWHTEQDFASGLTHTVTAELIPPPPPGEVERHSRRFAAVIGLGGVIDVTASNFPPTQASLVFGADFRLAERKGVAVDLGLRIPVELAQGWTNSGLLAAVRLVLELSQKVPLELVPSLDLGLSALHFDNSHPAIQSNKLPCPDHLPGDNTCTLLGLRIHPAISLVYRFLPNWEARAELFGLAADITSPIVNPRVTFGLAAAWRFY